jgi:LacI family transcriptional regulator
MRDVAQRAGVAPATVSNVLTGRRQVRQELKDRVLEAVDVLGYRRNELASSLRRMRSNTIGVFVPDVTNPFFSALIHRLEDLAAEDGYQILLASSSEDERREGERLRTLLSRRIDGLIMAPARDETSALSQEGIHLPPAVLMDRGFGHPQFDTVASDNVAAVRNGCRHLIGLGHRDIAFVVTSTKLANMRERIDGYRSSLAEAGLSGCARILAGGFSIEGCRSAVEQELRRAEPPTAVFAANYVAALGAMKAIRGLDLDLPRRVSLLGFDDSDWMTVLRPYLSVVAQPIEAIADQAWRLLMNRLQNADTPRTHVRLPCRLIVRESTQRVGVDVGRPRAAIELSS